MFCLKNQQKPLIPCYSLYLSFYLLWSIYSNNSHVGWLAGLSDIIIKNKNPRWFGPYWPYGFNELKMKIFFKVKFTMDAKWWKKLTWPSDMWTKKKCIKIKMEIWFFFHVTYISVHCTYLIYVNWQFCSILSQW